MRPQTSDATLATELSALLRTRRAALQPEDVGIPAGRRRRTPGLRREEVAQLAAISPTYYALLERGRANRPSRQVTDALATALRLSTTEREYLHALTSGSANGASASSREPEVLAHGIAELVDRLDPHPTYVTGRRWDVLAANRAARLLWTDWTEIPEPDRNMLWWTFTAPEARSVLVEWEHEAAVLLGRFRAAAAHHLGDPDFAELIERLQAASPQARAWWGNHEVAPVGGGTKRLRHSVLGEVTMSHVVLQVAEEPEQKLVTFTPSAHDTERIAALIR